MKKLLLLSTLLLTGCDGLDQIELPNFTQITLQGRADFEDATNCVRSEPAVRCGRIEIDMTNGVDAPDNERIQPYINKSTGKAYIQSASGQYYSWDIAYIEPTAANRAFWLEQEIWVTYSKAFWDTSPVLQFDCSVPFLSVITESWGGSLMNDCVARTTLRPL